MQNKYCNKAYTKDEIEEVLNYMREIIEEKPNCISLNSRNIKNRLFLLISGISRLGHTRGKLEVLKLFKQLEVNTFCHSEVDRTAPSDTLYCFLIDLTLPIHSQDAIDDYIKGKLEELQVETTTQLMLKFKFKKVSDEVMFCMSYHFPTKITEHNNHKKWTRKIWD